MELPPNFVARFTLDTEAIASKMKIEATRAKDTRRGQKNWLGVKKRGRFNKKKKRKRRKEEERTKKRKKERGKKKKKRGKKRKKKRKKEGKKGECHLLVLLVEFHLISPRWGLGGLKNLTVA